MIQYWLKILMFHVKLAMADGDGGGGDGGEGGGDGAGGGTGGGDGGSNQRPDYIPEKFWDEDKGELRAEAAFASYKELSTKLETAGKDAVEAYKKELEDGKAKPPADYKIELPEDLIPEGAEMVFPENDPLLGWFKGFAKEHGMSQNDFNAALAAYIKSDMEQGDAIRGTMDELGENAQERIDRVDLYLKRLLDNQEEYDALAQVVKSPRAVIALEKLIAEKNEPNLFKEGFGGDEGKITREDLKKMMDDPRYWREKDEAFIAEVQKQYARLYPGKQKAA